MAASARFFRLLVFFLLLVPLLDVVAEMSLETRPDMILPDLVDQCCAIHA